MLRFDEVENHLFFSVIYGIMYHQNIDTENIKKEDVQKILGENFYFHLLEIEPETMLDKSLFCFFQRCFSIKNAISKCGFFLKIFWKTKYVQISYKKKVKGKNEVTRNLSACVLKQFHGYKIIRKIFQRTEKQDFITIDIVFEPSFDLKVPVLCSYCPNVH